MMKWIFCPPSHWYVRELLQIRNMNGNMLRIHVHAYDHPSGNTNDPRLPEIADQMGVMLMWATPAWVRTGMGWGHIDWEGLPKYMRQVYNHPSIVMWEIAIIPSLSGTGTSAESDLYMEKAYTTVSEVDLSRLISYNSFIRHFHYWNDEGTIDFRGNPIDNPSPSGLHQWSPGGTRMPLQVIPTTGPAFVTGLIPIPGIFLRAKKGPTSISNTRNR
jgi:hypothetical protein